MHLASQLPAASAAPETEAADESVFVDPPPIVAWWLEGSARLADTRNLFTMGLRLRLGAEIGASTVREALLTLLDRHDALRLRLLRMSAGWVLSSGSAPQSLAFEEHAATPGDRRIEEIEQALHRGLDPCIGPIVRAAYVRLADEPHSLLILVVHHLAIDGVSWRILEDELQALLLPGPRATPAKAAGYLPWARAVARQAESIDAKALTDAWSARLPKVWGTLPCETTKQALEGNARILTRSLPATRSNQQSDTGFNEMLLTAVSWALSRWTQCESIVIDVEGHGRLERGITMDLTRSIGWFTSISPLHFDLRGCRHPNEALSRVRTAVTQHRGRALEWGLLRYSKAAPENSALLSLPARQLSFNYLGAFDTHQLGAATSVASVAGSLSAEQHPQAPRRYVIDVAAQVVDGRLHFGVKYSSELLQEPQIESWLDHIEVTLEQLIDTDEDQLACALEQVQL
jgi:non-ribosomal peptide synthase protein (TIGR01720 family)